MSLCFLEALEQQIHQEMLIRILACEKMNDLKDVPHKSSQKWPSEVDHPDRSLLIGNRATPLQMLEIN